MRSYRLWAPNALAAGGLFLMGLLLVGMVLWPLTQLGADDVLEFILDPPVEEFGVTGPWLGWLLLSLPAALLTTGLTALATAVTRLVRPKGTPHKFLPACRMSASASSGKQLRSWAS